MAKPIRVDFTGTEDSGGFYVSPGTYTIKCTKVTLEDGPKAQYLDFHMLVEGHGVTLHNRCTLKPDALFNLKNTLGALMGKEIPKSVVSIDPDKLVGRFCTAVVADKEDGGKTYANIVRLSPFVAPVVATGTPTDDLEEL